jgi:hypothetical protein
MTVVEKEIGVYAESREVLIEYLREVNLRPISGILLTIILRCGASRSYLSESDLPVADEGCDCGVVPYPHWFVKYREPAPGGEP